MEVSRIYQRAQLLVTDKTLPKEDNPRLARALQDLYSTNGCVGIGYDDSPEIASNKAATAYNENNCRPGEPAKTIRFKAYNGTSFCIMSTNEKAFNIKLEDDEL